MKENKREVMKAWIESSDEDMQVALDLFNNKRYSHCLFFCQLALEKLLKALYIKTQNTYPLPTHDLVKIARKANLKFSRETIDYLAEITTFNIEARYDIFKGKLYKKATKEFTKKYIDITEAIRSDLKKKL